MFGFDKPVLQIKNAIISQDNFPVLTDVSFEIRKGEFVYLIGRTGSGKSSLLKTLYADLPMASGDIEVAGITLKKIKKAKVPLLRRKLGIIFQDFQLLNDRTVAENLYFVLKATGWKDDAKIKQRQADVLIRVGLSTHVNKYPHQLSGGEQQRVVIARALLNEPALLIADEPTGNLDPEVADEIMNLFIEINKSGTSVLMATHNHQFLDKYPFRVLTCEKGKILDSSSAILA